MLLDRTSPGLLALSWPSKSLSPKLAFSPRLCTALLWAVTFAGEQSVPHLSQKYGLGTDLAFLRWPHLPWDLGFLTSSLGVEKPLAL